MAIMRSTALAALLLLLGLGGSLACVQLFGNAADSLAVSNGAHWDYAWRGDDWTGTCATGKRQSPMNLEADRVELGAQAFRTSWSFQPMTSNGNGNLEVFNNGHTIQVQWTDGTLGYDVQINTLGSSVVDVLQMNVGAVNPTAVKKVRAKPLQFHFHTDSEHTIDGAWYPLEMHIVHNVPQSELPTCPASGCYSVLGIMFALSDNDNPALDAIWEAMPMREGQKTYVPSGRTIDINAILPKDRTYISYEGSLTTPPCSEGLLWHVLTTPVPISLNQLRKYQRACSIKECTSSNSTTGRRLHGHDDHHHHHHESLGHAALVQRGMKEGFQLVAAASANGRSLLAESNVTDPNAWTCTPVAAGPANRIVQPANGRIIRLFPWGAPATPAANVSAPAAATPASTVESAMTLKVVEQIQDDIKATHAKIEDTDKLILGVGLGIGLGCTLLVLLAIIGLVVLMPLLRGPQYHPSTAGDVKVALA